MPLPDMHLIAELVGLYDNVCHMETERVELAVTMKSRIDLMKSETYSSVYNEVFDASTRAAIDALYGSL
jgi:hypothetical protein